MTRTLLAAWRVGFAHVFAYKAEAAIQLFSSLVIVGLNGSLWFAATRGRTQIAGVPSGEMLSYVVLAWVSVSFVASRVNEDLGRRIRDGQIVADLVRPANVQLVAWARDLGRACAAFVVQTVPMFLVCAAVVPIRWPERPATWLVWAASLVLAHALNFGLSFLVGLAAFKLGNVTGLQHLKGTLVSVFSGALIPVELFGPAMRSVIFALPFCGLAHTPASLFLERDVSAVTLLGGQAAWAAGLWLAGALAWRRAMVGLTVHGG